MNLPLNKNILLVISGLVVLACFSVWLKIRSTPLSSPVPLPSDPRIPDQINVLNTSPLKQDPLTGTHLLYCLLDGTYLQEERALTDTLTGALFIHCHFTINGNQHSK